jgi:hypothetical protein
MKILFLHGLESAPGGDKVVYLEGLGHTVLNPDLPRDDFDLSAQLAQEEIDMESPDLVIGSSRGGAVAMSLDLKGARLILIAPAWKGFDVPGQVPPGTKILHCTSDDIVHYEDSEQIQGEPALIPCGDNHRMSDNDALEALGNAVGSV